MLETVIFILVMVLDQVSKYMIKMNLPLGHSIPLIPGVFQLTNVHNTGAAWGMLSGGRVLFLLLTPVMCAIILYLLCRFHKQLHLVGRICLALLLAGAVGNFVDRLLFSYVQDMLDFCLIHFPVFNVADSSITIGAVLLLYDTFFHKEDAVLTQLDNIFPSRKEDANQKNGWISVDMQKISADEAKASESVDEKQIHQPGGDSTT